MTGLACPHCGDLNGWSAKRCLTCGGFLLAYEDDPRRRCAPGVRRLGPRRRFQRAPVDGPTARPPSG